MNLEVVLGTSFVILFLSILILVSAFRKLVTAKTIVKEYDNTFYDYQSLIRKIERIQRGTISRQKVLRLISSINSKKIDYNLLSELEQEVGYEFSYDSLKEIENVKGAYYYVSRKKGSQKASKSRERS